jgi:hypothetical protein
LAASWRTKKWRALRTDFHQRVVLAVVGASRSMRKSSSSSSRASHPVAAAGSGPATQGVRREGPGHRLQAAACRDRVSLASGQLGRAALELVHHRGQGALSFVIEVERHAE